MLTLEELPAEQESQRSYFDSAWKQVMNTYFKDFMALCWPEKYKIIDWDKPINSLDKELIRLDKDAAASDRFVDMVLDIHCLDGEVACLILHMEIQRSSGAGFEERMFSYWCRLRERYQKPIASLGILIDNRKSWRPEVYREALWGNWVEMGFPICKIMDYQNRWAELEQSSNPFAKVILAQLVANQKQSPDARLVSKTALTRSLYAHGWGGDDIRRLYVFIDWVLGLPKHLDRQYNKSVKAWEEELKVSYVTTAERLGIEQGVQLGVQQGESAVVLEILREKFNEVPAHYQEKINQTSAAGLLALARRAIRSQSIEDVFKA